MVKNLSNDFGESVVGIEAAEALVLELLEVDLDLHELLRHVLGNLFYGRALLWLQDSLGSMLSRNITFLKNSSNCRVVSYFRIIMRIFELASHSAL
jgi:hypothetical protein